MPRSPWPASAACTKKAGVPVEANVAAILRAIWPDLPSPVTMTRPLACRIRSVARAKAAPRSDRSAASIAAMPLPSASRVRKADWTAALTGSVPVGLAISGFEAGMRGSERVAQGRAAFLTRSGRRGDAMDRSQRLINHNCFNSVNDVFRTGCHGHSGGEVVMRMNLLRYFNRDVGAINRPSQARDLV